MASVLRSLALLSILVLLIFSNLVHAFGAGNIASIAAVEGKNWRHGDIEDILKQVSCIRKHKWNSMMIKRVYFGNWLRDYSQAMDTGALKKAQPDTIRILVWLLSFLGFGYATAEFEVTSERLGVYRPEEHIDNPKDYNDNLDARQYDPRLRGPVRDIELQIDPETGMKNYIANAKGDWATSAAFVKYSFEQSIHHGRLYTNGHGFFRGKDEDLAEACRCLGQGLHTLEDFGAHSNYVELALIEMGHRNVFPHVGTQTMINLGGRHVYPLVTGTFGMVDFYHSVLGEATDHFTQSEVNEMDNALGIAQQSAQSSNPLTTLVKLLSKVPGTKDLCAEAERLSAYSQAQTRSIEEEGWGGGGARGLDDDYSSSRAGPGDYNQNYQSPATPEQPLQQPASTTQSLPGLQNFDPAKFIKQIYPILAFRDKVVRAISAIIEKIPGLEALVERIQETLTIFIFSLLAPLVRPVLNAISKTLQTGSNSVIDSSGKHQYEVWTNPQSSNPTHSMLSKDHFSNILNDPAGNMAAEILKFIAPRVLYAWEHADVPVERVLADVDDIFHHPAIRNEHKEIHRNMYQAVQKWVSRHRGAPLDQILSSESVRAGKNHIAGVNDHAPMHQAPPQQQQQQGGLAGVMDYASSFISGQHGGQQHHHHQSYNTGSHTGGSSAGLGDMLSLAGKLPIPGASNLSMFGKLVGATSGSSSSPFAGGSHSGFGSTLGQLANFAGGRRSLEDDYEGSNSRGVGADDQSAFGAGPADSSRPDTRRSPSPLPLAPPPGYEQYGAGAGAGDAGGEGIIGGGGGYTPHGYQDQGSGGYGR
ncbi:hypothetical protein DV736_g2198, partial [Chaetothyriales sp. CBS 134916]